MPDKIVFGQAASLSGEWGEVTRLTSDPIYKMWIEEVNDEGGLYIEKYDKKIPIELLQYDEGDVEKMKDLIEKLILEDKVDFLLPPTGTTFLHEAALITNKYGYILMGGVASQKVLVT
jgi:branched-chain amino acid transport system substrate-binding protein